LFTEDRKNFVHAAIQRQRLVERALLQIAMMMPVAPDPSDRDAHWLRWCALTLAFAL
jgi:hypothetical protein